MVGELIILELFKICLKNPIPKMKKLLFLLVGAFLFSCGNKKTTINDFTWLQGKWEGASQDLNFFEEWKPSQENVLDGFGGGISGKDTVFSEKIKIEERADGIFYVPTVKENGGAVDFKFTGYKNDSIVFENPQHDFPQRIIYFRLPNNKLYACIDGLENGKYNRIAFFYNEVK